MLTALNEPVEITG